MENSDKFEGDKLVWLLNNRTSTATHTSPRYNPVTATSTPTVTATTTRPTATTTSKPAATQTQAAPTLPKS